jgi:FkbM family methyltransferase
MALYRLFDLLFKRKYGMLRYQNHFATLHAMAQRGLNIGPSADVLESGEAMVLELLDNRPGEIVVFDVGANIGEWSELAQNRFGSRARIFSFEPSAATFARLKERVGQHRNITLVNAGLGKEAANVTLYSDAEASGLASIYQRRLDHLKIEMMPKETIRLSRLNDFCRENGIAHIDLLKIDVEGNDLAVLQGAGDMLQNGAIDLIQFEFGGANIDSRTFFQDFWYLLSPHYQIYRVVKNGFMPVPRYQESQEIFVMTNYLAVSRGANWTGLPT